MKEEIVKINASDYGLEESKAHEVEAMFMPMLTKMKELEIEYNDIIQSPIDPETCQRAKDLRLTYVKVRTKTAEIHKELKAFYLNGGRFVDGWKNAQLTASGEKEKTLKSIEDHFENLEKERIEKLRIDRENQLKKYTEIMPLALGHMEQEVFDNYMAGTKLAHDAKLAAEKKAEEDRLAAIEAEKKRQEEIRIENERLKKEAVEKEKALEIERKKQAEILKAEQDKAEQERKKAEVERKRLEAENFKKLEIERREKEIVQKELDLKREAEQKERDRVTKDEKERIAAEKKAARAPDKIKLIALSEVIGKIEMPIVKSKEAQNITDNVLNLLQKTTSWLNDKISEL